MAQRPTPKKTNEDEHSNQEKIKANLKKPEPGELTNLNFKVPATFKRDFKIAAATYGKTQVDLLQEIFEFWSQHYSERS